jgi:2Fe-2S ferredoxin
MEKYTLTYINSFGQKHRADFKVNEYPSLMELLFDKYLEEWGDCKGRAWCGTCHIQILKGTINESMEKGEVRTLSKIEGSTSRSRLACRIPLSRQLNGTVLRLVGDL